VLSGIKNIERYCNISKIIPRKENIGPRIGAHKSIAKGIDKAVDEEIEINTTN
jgi:hypothetical protein